METLRREDKISNNKTVKVGMYMSLIIGLLYIFIGILLPADPAERYRGEEFFRQIAEHGTIPHTWRMMFTVIGILTVFWVASMSTIIEKKVKKYSGFYKGVMVIGYAGAAVSAMEWYRELFLMKNYMVSYADADDVYQLICQLSSVGVDPNFIWKFGGLGMWYFLSCLMVQREHIFSKAVNCLGIIAGLDLVASMIFAMTDTIVYFPNGMQMTVMQMTALLGGVLGGIYHICMFFELKKSKI